jgi:CBS domain-containing protein
MACDPTPVPLGETAIEVPRLTEGRRHHHLPIVDNGKLLGIVSRST